LITHAHRDHVNGVGTLSKQFNTPVWGHPQTLDYLTFLLKKNQYVNPWKGKFTIKNMTLSPFTLSHDAVPTVGYRISDNNKTMAVCTDLGVVTQEVESSLEGIDFLIIESNHDPELLKNGPYPIDLKMRISSDVGHLSNQDTGMLLRKILHKNMQKILLAHLSDENNSCNLAKNTVLEYVGPQFEDLIDIIEQRKLSPIFEF
jgi:phosphoribosyl 1,2-cyclic phosphodiesterase